MTNKKNISSKVILLIVISLIVSAVSHAQWYDPEKVNKKAYAIYESAYQNALDQKYDAAIANIDKAIAIDPKFVEAWLTKAGIYADRKKYDSSVINFEAALQLDAVVNFGIQYLSNSRLFLSTKEFHLWHQHILPDFCRSRTRPRPEFARRPSTTKAG